MVVTKNGAGKLSVRATLSLGSYTNEPVTVRLDDGDTQPIAKRLIPSLPPGRGTPPKKWEFKTKADGLQKVTLRPVHNAPGQFKLSVKAKHWFAFTGGADQPAASTSATVRIGAQCFTHAATKKLD